MAEHGTSGKSLCLAALAALLAPLPTFAAVPPPDANRYGEAGLMELPRGEVFGDGRLSIGAWFNYFYNHGDQGFRPSPISLGLNLPVIKTDFALSFSAADPADPWRRSNDVQLRVGLKRQILSRLLKERYPVSLAAGLRLENLLAYPDLGGFVAAERRLWDFTLVSSVGYRFATSSSLTSALYFGAGAERRIKRKLSFSAEGIGTWATDGAWGGSFVGTVRWAIVGKFDLVVSFAGGLGTEPRVRATVGLGYQPSAPGREDFDGDGIPDDVDLCPDDPEDIEGYLDSDGCPEGGPPPGYRPGGGLHKGPVQLRMRIPEQPIPVWIMEQPEKKKERR